MQKSIVKKRDIVQKTSTILGAIKIEIVFVITLQYTITFKPVLHAVTAFSFFGSKAGREFKLQYCIVHVGLPVVLVATARSPRSQWQWLVLDRC